MNLLDYRKNYYQFLLDNNFMILKERTRYSISLSAHKKDDPDFFKNNPNKYEKFYSEKDCLDFIVNNSEKKISVPTNINIVIDFFIKKFNESNKEDKSFLAKNIADTAGNLWNKNLIKILTEINISSKELISTINQIPISVWEATSVNLNELDSCLSKQVKSEDLDSFYIKFFKARKNQLKHSKVGPIVRDFLIEKYGREEKILKPYFDFFNYIKDEFCEIELNFQEMNTKNTISTRINCRKASQLLCMDGFNEVKIREEVSKFVYAFKAYKQIEQLIIDDYDKSKAVIEIRIYTDSDLTQEDLNKEIKEFLLFKKRNPDLETTKENIEKYLMKKDLDILLPNNTQGSTVKKIKI